MKTSIQVIAHARWALINIATAVIILAGISSTAFAAGEHQGGHGPGNMPGGMPDNMPGNMKSGMQGGGAGHGHGFDFGMPGKAFEVSRTVNVVMKDNYFDLKSIKVKAGETIRFNLVNKGKFLHEFGLGTAAMHTAHQKQMMTMMEHGMIEADKINHQRMKMDHGNMPAMGAKGGMGRMGKMGGGMPMMSHNDPNSILLEPGKLGEVIWKFTKPMKLEFACNVPGHYQSGMMGKIKFK